MNPSFVDKDRESTLKKTGEDQPLVEEGGKSPIIAPTTKEEVEAYYYR